MNFLQGEIAIQSLAYAIFYGNQYFKLKFAKVVTQHMTTL